MEADSQRWRKHLHTVSITIWPNWATSLYGDTVDMLALQEVAGSWGQVFINKTKVILMIWGTSTEEGMHRRGRGQKRAWTEEAMAEVMTEERKPKKRKIGLITAQCSGNLLRVSKGTCQRDCYSKLQSLCYALCSPLSEMGHPPLRLVTCHQLSFWTCGIW